MFLRCPIRKLLVQINQSSHLICFCYNFLTERSHERRNELIPAWKPVWKQVLFTWSFISGAFWNDRIFWWTCVGISFRVVFTWYHPKWNFISVKMTDMKSIPALSFKRKCALNATSNESALIHFVSGKSCSHENLIPVWNFILVKMTNMSSIPFWVSFGLNSYEHK